MVTRLGNAVLVDYGIQNEDSDMRAHVCVASKAAFVYPTSGGVAAITTGKYRKVSAKQGDIVTALGYLVPPRDIAGCRGINITRLLSHITINRTDTTTAKGDNAVRVITSLLRSGHFPLPVDPQVVTDAQMQITGLDVLVNMCVRIQIKCDFDGGPVAWGGSGNLFLQVSECNPFAAH